MRKYAIGIVVGVVMMYSGQAVAESISKVGKKVQTEYIVKVDGKVIDAKALSIDGQTTIPSRALANAIGYDIAFVNKEVLLTKKEEVKVVETQTDEPITSTSPEPVITEPEYTLESISNAIDGGERDLRASSMSLKIAEDNGYKEEELERLRNGLKKEEAELERLKTIKAKLEAQK